MSRGTNLAGADDVKPDRVVTSSVVTSSVAGRVREIVLVYDSDHGLIGDLRYLARKLRGEGCGLCEITHGAVREKGDFAACRLAFPVLLTTRYRDQLSPAARAIAKEFPCALLVTDSETKLFLGREKLAGCQGSVARLDDLLRQTLTDVEADAKR